MIRYSHQIFVFTTSWAWYKTNSSPRKFLNKDDIKRKFCFENCVDNQIVFSYILWKDFNIFNNHDLLLFTVEWIDCLLLLWIFWYSFKCHSLLLKYSCFINLANCYILYSIYIYPNSWITSTLSFILLNFF